MTSSLSSNSSKSAIFSLTEDLRSQESSFSSQGEKAEDFDIESFDNLLDELAQDVSSEDTTVRTRAKQSQSSVNDSASRERKISSHKKRDKDVLRNNENKMRDNRTYFLENQQGIRIEERITGCTNVYQQDLKLETTSIVPIKSSLTSGAITPLNVIPEENSSILICADLSSSSQNNVRAPVSEMSTMVPSDMCYQFLPSSPSLELNATYGCVGPRGLKRKGNESTVRESIPQPSKKLDSKITRSTQILNELDRYRSATPIKERVTIPLYNASQSRSLSSEESSMLPNMLSRPSTSSSCALTINVHSRMDTPVEDTPWRIIYSPKSTGTSELHCEKSSSSRKYPKIMNYHSFLDPQDFENTPSNTEGTCKIASHRSTPQSTTSFESLRSRLSAWTGAPRTRESQHCMTPPSPMRSYDSVYNRSSHISSPGSLRSVDLQSCEEDGHRSSHRGLLDAEDSKVRVCSENSAHSMTQKFVFQKQYESNFSRISSWETWHESQDCASAEYFDPRLSIRTMEIQIPNSLNGVTTLTLVESDGPNCIKPDSPEGSERVSSPWDSPLSDSEGTATEFASDTVHFYVVKPPSPHEHDFDKLQSSTVSQRIDIRSNIPTSSVPERIPSVRSSRKNSHYCENSWDSASDYEDNDIVNKQHLKTFYESQIQSVRSISPDMCDSNVESSSYKMMNAPHFNTVTLSETLARFSDKRFKTSSEILLKTIRKSRLSECINLLVNGHACSATNSTLSLKRSNSLDSSMTFTDERYLYSSPVKHKNKSETSLKPISKISKRKLFLDEHSLPEFSEYNQSRSIQFSGNVQTLKSPKTTRFNSTFLQKEIPKFSQEVTVFTNLGSVTVQNNISKQFSSIHQKRNEFLQSRSPVLYQPSNVFQENMRWKRIESSCQRSPALTDRNILERVRHSNLISDLMHDSRRIESDGEFFLLASPKTSQTLSNCHELNRHLIYQGDTSHSKLIYHNCYIQPPRSASSTTSSERETSQNPHSSFLEGKTQNSSESRKHLKCSTRFSQKNGALNRYLPISISAITQESQIVQSDKDKLRSQSVISLHTCMNVKTRRSFPLLRNNPSISKLEVIKSDLDLQLSSSSPIGTEARKSLKYNHVLMEKKEKQVHQNDHSEYDTPQSHKSIQNLQKESTAYLLNPGLVQERLVTESLNDALECDIQQQKSILSSDPHARRKSYKSMLSMKDKYTHPHLGKVFSDWDNKYITEVSKFSSEKSQVNLSNRFADSRDNVTQDIPSFATSSAYCQKSSPSLGTTPSRDSLHRTDSLEDLYHHKGYLMKKEGRFRPISRRGGSAHRTSKLFKDFYVHSMYQEIDSKFTVSASLPTRQSIHTTGELSDSKLYFNNKNDHSLPCNHKVSQDKMHVRQGEIETICNSDKCTKNISEPHFSPQNLVTENHESETCVDSALEYRGTLTSSEQKSIISTCVNKLQSKQLTTHGYSVSSAESWKTLISSKADFENKLSNVNYKAYTKPVSETTSNSKSSRSRMPAPYDKTHPKPNFISELQPVPSKSSCKDVNSVEYLLHVRSLHIFSMEDMSASSQLEIDLLPPEDKRGPTTTASGYGFRVSGGRTNRVEGNVTHERGVLTTRSLPTRISKTGRCHTVTRNQSSTSIIGSRFFESSSTEDETDKACRRRHTRHYIRDVGDGDLTATVEEFRTPLTSPHNSDLDILDCEDGVAYETEIMYQRGRNVPVHHPSSIAKNQTSRPSSTLMLPRFANVREPLQLVATETSTEMKNDNISTEVENYFTIAQHSGMADMKPTLLNTPIPTAYVHISKDGSIMNHDRCPLAGDIFWKDKFQDTLLEVKTNEGAKICNIYSVDNDKDAIYHDSQITNGTPETFNMYEILQIEDKREVEVKTKEREAGRRTSLSSWDVLSHNKTPGVAEGYSSVVQEQLVTIEDLKVAGNVNRRDRESSQKLVHHSKSGTQRDEPSDSYMAGALSTEKTPILTMYQGCSTRSSSSSFGLVSLHKFSTKTGNSATQKTSSSTVDGRASGEPLVKRVASRAREAAEAGGDPSQRAREPRGKKRPRPRDSDQRVGARVEVRALGNAATVCADAPSGSFGIRDRKIYDMVRAEKLNSSSSRASSVMRAAIKSERIVSARAGRMPLPDIPSMTEQRLPVKRRSSSRRYAALPYVAHLLARQQDGARGALTTPGGRPRRRSRRVSRFRRCLTGIGEALSNVFSQCCD